MEFAFLGGNIEIVQYLVEECHCGIPVFSLHLVSECGHLHLVKYLVLEKQCDIISYVNSDGETPLETAYRCGQSHVVEFFQSLPSKSTQSSRRNPRDRNKENVHTRAHLAEGKHSTVLMHGSPHNDTPMTIAMRNNDIPKIKSYISNKIHTRDFHGATPLHIAYRYSSNGIVLICIRDLECDISALDNLHRTPLHYAAMGGDAHVVESVLGFRADPLSEDVFHNLPLHYAAALGRSDAVKMFIESDTECPLNTRGALNMTPLEMATAGRHHDVVRYLKSLRKM